MSMRDHPAPSRRDIVLGGILLGASGAGAFARPRATPVTIAPAALDRAIPAQVGSYRATTATDAVLPPRDELSLQTYDRYVLRAYVADGLPPIILLVAYGSQQDYALQIHRPESCYPASGFSIGEPQAVPVTLAGRRIAATVLSAWRPGRREQILYWARIGDDYPPTIWAQRLRILREMLARRVPDGVIVRLSTPSAAPDAIAQLIGFNAALVAGLAPAARRILLGSGAPVPLSGAGRTV